MGSSLQFYITDRAEQELKGILQYISQELSSPLASKGFYENILNAYEQIERFPLIGSPMGRLYKDRSEYRKYIVKGYNIYYAVLDEGIFIVSIMHQTRSHENLK